MDLKQNVCILYRFRDADIYADLRPRGRREMLPHPPILPKNSLTLNVLVETS